MRRSLVVGLLLSCLVALNALGAPTLLPGYAIETYVTGIPNPSCVTIDAETGTIYYGSFGSTDGRLYAVDRDRTLRTLNSRFARDVGSMYPYLATELEYADGFVYSLLPSRLASVDATTGASTLAASFSSIGNESGIAHRGDQLYMVPGHGWARALLSYDVTSGATAVEVPGLPQGTYGLEYDAAGDRFLFSDAYRNLHAIDLAAGTHTLIGSLGTQSRYTHFAVDPLGEFAYSIQETQVLRLDLSAGTLETFITGLPASTYDNYLDLTFGPSSDDTGWSLYLLQQGAILEVKGFAAPPGTVAASFQLGSLAKALVRKFGLSPEAALATVATYGSARVRLALALSGDHERFVAALAGFVISEAPSAGGGGGIEGPVVPSSCTVGDLLICTFELTDSLSGEPIDDAICTLTLMGPGGPGSPIAAYELIQCDEETGLYRICLDSAGLAPGQYIAYIGCGDLETHAYEIEVVAP